MLRADVRVADRDLDLSQVGFIGSPAHGCFTLPVTDEEATTLVRFDRPLTPALQRFLEHASELRIPASDATRFVHTYYPRLRHTAFVQSADGSVPLPVVSGPRLALTVTYSGTSTALLSWSFRYDVGDQRQLHPLSGQLEAFGVRDRVAEADLVGSIDLPNEPVPLGIVTEGGVRLVPEQQLDGMETVAFTEQQLPRLRALSQVDVEIAGDVPDFRLADAAPQVAVSATDTTDRDWFDLGVTVTVDGHDVEFASLFAALAAGETHLLLENGTYFPLDDPVFAALTRLIEEARALNDRPSSGLAINRFQAGLWEELVGLGIVERQSHRWATAVEGLLHLEALPEPEPPEGIDAELRSYQLHGYRWLRFLWDHELGGILADDMGLGKTLQTLALIVSARADADGCPANGGAARELSPSGTTEEVAAGVAPVLVVAPTSVIGTWVAEAARFAPALRVVAVDSTEHKRGVPLAEVTAGADLVVTSYTLFRIDEAHYQALDWSALVLDEAQFVKNHRAKTYQCARKLAAPVKLAITGTPLENSLMDLWALLSIVAPGLFPQPKVFADLFAKPIERGDRELLATLRRRIRPLLLRRTKEEVATELPPKQESVLPVELAPRHRKVYETHLQRERQKILGLIDDMQKNRFTILRSLTLLRQLSLDPALVDEQYDGIGSAKIEALLEHLDEVVSEGHRALVFSQFTGFLRRVRDRLDASGIGYVYLDGRTRKRAGVIDAFKSGAAPVFVISLKAGGFGLNLTEADYCFVLDPWWNPAVEAQAVDRTHRIGQRRTVMVYRLVSTDTIETKVMELKARKQQLFSSVMDDDGAFGAALTADDIRGLLSV
jgi:superfamily II DNA or RNA helicase